MSDIVVSDSTCLIGLERIHRLDLLPAVFERVWIPSVVAEEFGQSIPWLHVKAPVNTDLVESFETMVDRGEAAAIALARELHCEVILDDRRARRDLAGSGASGRRVQVPRPRRHDHAMDLGVEFNRPWFPAQTVNHQPSCQRRPDGFGRHARTVTQRRARSNPVKKVREITRAPI